MSSENIINFTVGDRVRRINRGGRGTVTHVVNDCIYVHWDGKSLPVLDNCRTKPCSASLLKRITEHSWTNSLKFESDQANQFTLNFHIETFKEQDVGASLRHLNVYELSSEHLHNKATKWKIWNSETTEAVNAKTSKSYVL